MKKSLVILAVMAALPLVALAADTTSATTSSSLNVTVMTPVALTCPTTIAFQVVQHATGITNSAPKAVECTVTGGPAATTVTSQILSWSVSDLSDGATNTLPATGIAAGQTSAGTFYAATAANTPLALFTDVAATSMTDTYDFYLQAQVPAAQAAAAYTGTVTFALDVVYTP
jgi:hypothetical protein